MINRREFLKLLGLGGAAVVMPWNWFKREKAAEPTSLPISAQPEPVAAPVKDENILLKCFIAGYYYYAGEDLEEGGELNEGDGLLLTREPGNPYDNRAIRVSTRDGIKLGYIPRERNAKLARLMDEGNFLKARIAHIFPENETYLRVRVHVSM
jgi:hypothetical protein